MPSKDKEKRTAEQAAEELVAKLTDAQAKLVTTKSGAGDYVIVKSKAGGSIASVRPHSVKITIPTPDAAAIAAAAKVLGAVAKAADAKAE